MKKIIIKLKESTLRELVRNNSFNCPYSYQFVAIRYEHIEKVGFAKPYHADIISSNNWINYPGIKIWSATNEKISKSEALASLIDSVKEVFVNELNFINSHEVINGVRYEFEYIEN